MALYTSYYARQLALRPETIAADLPSVEGDKTVQKAVARRTIDLNGAYLQWKEVSDSCFRRQSFLGCYLGLQLLQSMTICSNRRNIRIFIDLRRYLGWFSRQKTFPS